jgi:hypothetical protein
MLLVDTTQDSYVKLLRETLFLSREANMTPEYVDSLSTFEQIFYVAELERLIKEENSE